MNICIVSLLMWELNEYTDFNLHVGPVWYTVCSRKTNLLFARDDNVNIGQTKTENCLLFASDHWAEKVKRKKQWRRQVRDSKTKTGKAVPCIPAELKITSNVRAPTTPASFNGTRATTTLYTCYRTFRSYTSYRPTTDYF